MPDSRGRGVICRREAATSIITVPVVTRLFRVLACLACIATILRQEHLLAGLSAVLAGDLLSLLCTNR
jgi:hypothetical protein